MTNSPHHIHADDTSELLSSYLDDGLDPGARWRVDDLIRTCPGCAADLDDFRRLRTALRALPAPLPRRSFTLDPAQARPRWRLFPIFRLGSLVAALLLFFVLGVDAVGLPRSRPTSAALAPAGNTAQSAPAAKAQSYSARSAATSVVGQAYGQAASAESGAGAAAPPAAPAGQAEAGATQAAALEAPAAGTAGAATTGGAMVSGAATTEPAVSSLRALTAPASTPAEATLASPAAGGAAPPQALHRTENSPPRTTTLDTSGAVAAPGPVRPSVRPIRIFEYALAVAAVGLGLAAWWVGRRR